jgi:hypothetical protein
MATSMASTRFSASRFFSIAAFQSIDTFLDPGRGNHRPAGKGGDKGPWIFLRKTRRQGLFRRIEKRFQ